MDSETRSGELGPEVLLGPRKWTRRSDETEASTSSSPTLLTKFRY